MAVDQTAEHIQHIVSAFRKQSIQIACLITGAFAARGELGESGIQLLRIFHLGDNQNDAFIGKRYRLYHQRDIISFKTEFNGCLLHHIPKQLFCLFRAISQLAQLNLAVGQVIPGQGTAYLVVIQFFYSHNPHIQICKSTGSFLLYTFLKVYTIFNRKSIR